MTNTQHPEYTENGDLHYGMTQDEARARYKSNGNFEGPLPLCGNGSYHCRVTSDKPSVTCEACKARF